MEIRSACGCGSVVLFLDSKGFIALCGPDERCLLKQSRLTRYLSKRTDYRLKNRC